MTRRNHILTFIVGVFAIAIIVGALFVHRPSPAAPTQAAPSTPDTHHAKSATKPAVKPSRPKKHSEAKKTRKPEIRREQHTKREQPRRERHEHHRKRHNDNSEAVQTQAEAGVVLGHSCAEVRWAKDHLSQEIIDYHTRRSTKAQRQAGWTCLNNRGE